MIESINQDILRRIRLKEAQIELKNAEVNLDEDGQP